MLPHELPMIRKPWLRSFLLLLIDCKAVTRQESSVILNMSAVLKVTVKDRIISNLMVASSSTRIARRMLD